MNTKEDFEIIQKYTKMLPHFETSSVVEWVHVIALTLKQMDNMIQTKDKIIDRLIREKTEKD